MPIGRIQLKHGLESSADFNSMLQAEAYYATDTERLMISNGDGTGLLLPSKPELDTIQDDVDTLANNLNLVELNLWKTIYPIGCLFETTDSVFNPQTHFGGTWEQYGAGRVTVGYSSGETEFNAAGKTGGAKTHTLTISELAQHNHTSLTSPVGQALASSVGGAQTGYGGVGANTGNSANQYSTSNRGDNSPHNNLQPYITVFRWRRTA